MIRDKMVLPFHRVGPGQQSGADFVAFTHLKLAGIPVLLFAPAATTGFLMLVMGTFGELGSPWPVFSSGDLPTGVPQGGGDEALLR